jgi:hypothetical protein
MPLRMRLLFDSATDWSLGILLALTTVFLVVQMIRAARINPGKPPAENGHNRAERRERNWYSVAAFRWSGKQKVRR